MERVHFVGLDVHTQGTEMAVVSQTGRVTRRERCKTTIPDLLTIIKSIGRPRYVVIEEGPIADWLLRNLSDSVDSLTICDPRRNHLIAKDSDKDDPIDAEKLAQLHRGGYIKPVHHPESFDRVVFKRHVNLYHDRVRQRVRQANRIMAELRQYGVFVQESAFNKVADSLGRAELLRRLPRNATVCADLRCLWKGYDAVVEQVEEMEERLIRLAKKQPQIRRFTALPGVKWIRAATFFAYVDTPWRFKSKSALWKYLGIGLERRHSGGGTENVHLAMWTHRRLKYTILGAAQSATASRDNPFADQYERWIHEGLTPRIARRNVARSQAAVMWGMWKNGSVYRPELVGVTNNGRTMRSSQADRRTTRGRRSSPGGIGPSLRT